jgi:hypothetical protein
MTKTTTTQQPLGTARRCWNEQTSKQTLRAKFPLITPGLGEETGTLIPVVAEAVEMLVAMKNLQPASKSIGGNASNTSN